MALKFNLFWVMVFKTVFSGWDIDNKIFDQNLMDFDNHYKKFCNKFNKMFTNDGFENFKKNFEFI